MSDKPNFIVFMSSDRPTYKHPLSDQNEIHLSNLNTDSQRKWHLGNRDPSCPTTRL